MVIGCEVWAEVQWSPVTSWLAVRRSRYGRRRRSAPCARLPVPERPGASPKRFRSGHARGSNTERVCPSAARLPRSYHVGVDPFCDFAGRLAVVTGAGSGIGRELVAALAGAGAHVAACDIRARAVATTAREVGRRFPDVLVSAHECDVADAASVDSLRDQVVDRHAAERVHVLVNNAAVVGGGSFVTGDPAEWDRTFDVAWMGTYRCTRAFLPLLMKAERGVLVNVASVNALWASVGPGYPHTAYSTSKFAIRGFTESLIVDFAENAPNLSAVLVLPGRVRTGMPAPPPSWRHALDSLVADVKPMSAADAAYQIINGLAQGEWRILIGEDAQRIDQRTRLDPASAYD